MDRGILEQKTKLVQRLDKVLKIEEQREQYLTEKLQQKEVELRYAENEREKIIRDRRLAKNKFIRLRQRKTWRYTKFIRISMNILKKAIKLGSGQYILRSKYDDLVFQNKMVLKEKSKLEGELDRTIKKLNAIKGIDGTNEGNLQKKLKDAKLNSNILECLDNIIKKREIHDKEYSKALKYAAKLFEKDKTELKYKVFEKVLSGLKIEELPEFIVKNSGQGKLVSIKQASSFRASMSMRSRKRQLGEFGPEWTLNNKVDSYAFIDELGVRRPWVNGEQLKYSEVPRKQGIVIKPTQGASANGVYLVISEHKILDIKRSRILKTWEALESSMKDDLNSGKVINDSWMVEELVFEDRQMKRPARDLKFFCFYGQVALILEIIQFPDKQYCWWGANGERVYTGKYDKQLFKGLGVSRNQLELAASISSEIPAPFIRIDFLKSQEGLVFGEFTPRPGNYDQFDKPTDQLLGDYFLEAEGRLVSDLLHGKRFERFRKYVSRYG